MGWLKNARNRVKKYRAAAKGHVPELTRKLLGKMTTAQLKRAEKAIEDELWRRGA